MKSNTCATTRAKFKTELAHTELVHKILTSLQSSAKYYLTLITTGGHQTDLDSWLSLRSQKVVRNVIGERLEEYRNSSWPLRDSNEDKGEGVLMFPHERGTISSAF